MKKLILIALKILIDFYIAYCKKSKKSKKQIKNLLIQLKWLKRLELLLILRQMEVVVFKQSDFDQLKATLNGYDTEFIDTKVDVDGSDALTVTSSGVGITPLTIKAVASQTASLLDITDNSDVSVCEVTAGGNINNKEGIRTVTTQYGAGLGVQLYGEDTPEHVNQSGYYDHTGGAFEKLFTKTAGDAFTQADADNGTHLLLTGITNAHPICEVKEYISATQVIVDGYGWVGDIASVGTPSTFLSLKHPSFISGDGAKHEFSVESAGEFEIASYDFTGDKMVEMCLDAAIDGAWGMFFEGAANGYNSITSTYMNYISGDIQPGDVGASIRANIDTGEAGNADATTLVGAVVASQAGNSDATKQAFVVLTGFDEALSVAGASITDMDYGYEVASASVADRQAAYSSDGTNVQLFDADDDYILVGNDDVFEVINVVLSTTSSKDIVATFEYSTGNGTWSALTLASEGTNGFKNNGQIIFDAPGGWAKGNEAEAAADITSAYYIKITRTYSSVIPTLPIESTIQIFSSRDAGMIIYGDGTVQLPYLGAAPPNLN